jgi:hypothetical protein
VDPRADTASHVAAILNAAWMVRHYARGGRQSSASPARTQRAEAIHKLGLTVRQAFNASDDFETLLQAVVDGLIPKEEPRF